MNNTQLYLSIGLPMLVFILTWLSNRAEMTKHIDRLDRQFEGLRGEMISLRRDMNADIKALRSDINADMKALRSDVNADINALRSAINGDMVAFRREVHGDLLMLHERVVKVESKES